MNRILEVAQQIMNLLQTSGLDEDQQRVALAIVRLVRGPAYLNVDDALRKQVKDVIANQLANERRQAAGTTVERPDSSVSNAATPPGA
jgi:membrane-bound ClpP family serine protease